MYVNPFQVSLETLIGAAPLLGHTLEDRRGIRDGDWVCVFNDRGRFRARAKVGTTVKSGVVVTLGNWWNKYTQDGVNCNTTTSARLTDLGGGATFFDNLVEVAAL